MNDMARIVRTGDGQSVELPEGYRFEGEQVFVRREGNRVVLETAEDAIDPDTGLTIARLRELIQEGLDSGPSAPLDMESIKRRGRERLASGIRSSPGSSANRGRNATSTASGITSPHMIGRLPTGCSTCC